MFFFFFSICAIGLLSVLSGPGATCRAAGCSCSALNYAPFLHSLYPITSIGLGLQCAAAAQGGIVAGAAAAQGGIVSGAAASQGGIVAGAARHSSHPERGATQSEGTSQLLGPALFQAWNP